MKTSKNYKNYFIACCVGAGIFTLAIFSFILSRQWIVALSTLLYVALFGIGANVNYKKWKNLEQLEQNGLVQNDIKVLESKVSTIQRLCHSCQNTLNNIDKRDLDDTVNNQLSLIARKAEELSTRLGKINKSNINLSENELDALIDEWHNLNNELTKIRNDIMCAVKYIIPDGYEVSDTIEKTTRVRGVYYNDVSDIDNGDDVIIVHRPTAKYPESTEIIKMSDGSLLGHLMQEMATDFVVKFGKGFRFIGKVIDYETEEDYDNDEDEDDDKEEKVSKIIISFEVPLFKKIKKK